MAKLITNPTDIVYVFPEIHRILANANIYTFNIKNKGWSINFKCPISNVTYTVILVNPMIKTTFASNAKFITISNHGAPIIVNVSEYSILSKKEEKNDHEKKM